jgi:hypothetical protein
MFSKSGLVFFFVLAESAVKRTTDLAVGNDCRAALAKCPQSVQPKPISHKPAWLLDLAFPDFSG